MSGAVVAVHDLHFGYARGIEVLSGLSFEVEPGSFVAVAGPNGAGKSTLIGLLSGLLRPRSGRISIEGRVISSYSVAELAQQVAVVRQEAVPVFGFSVQETVMMGRTSRFGRWGFASPRDEHAVGEAMEATDSAAFAGRAVGSLSAGERQRVFIARALAQDTPILLLDEPTSFLDLRHQVGIYDLLKQAQRQSRKTIIAVTHDLNLACQYCEQALLLAGRDAAGTTPLASHAGPPAGNETPRYLSGAIEDVLRREDIERTFGVDVHVGRVGKGAFFLPMGRSAKDGGAERP